MAWFKPRTLNLYPGAAVLFDQLVDVEYRGSIQGQYMFQSKLYISQNDSLDGAYEVQSLYTLLQ